METQKIVNLLEDSDDDDVLRFPTKNGTSLMIKTMDNMEKEMKMIQLLNLIQKLLKQIFVTSQMHIFL